ncbi:MULTISPECIES: hypothetical protein [unclassified Rhodococcus (in: high G+C Gram-positive bacteria)]|uniref:hypothetical protein n=1 Tax=unclassified Rhodococcus (in: high G+C Gram-positive bacteria) TaxID=192944 RepID=UPI0015C5A871|nr:MULTISPECIES: hypothetical protein [unclassified Rhodococcus (in: high G+C Gram-positive bacteria)]
MTSFMDTIVHDGRSGARGARIEARITARRAEFGSESHEAAGLALMRPVMPELTRTCP